MDAATLFAAHNLLAALPARARDRLIPQAQVSLLAAGDTSNAAEIEDVSVFMVSGTMRASSLTGGAIFFHDVEAGGVLGLAEAMLGRRPQPTALLALSDAQAIILPAASALAAICAGAAAASALALHFARALDQRASVSDPLQLVYRDILRAAKPMGDTRWTIDPMPRHRDLAQRAGVGEDEAASAIANLVRLGVARRRYPALDIEDREALRSLAR